jgi:hypothetical protein
MPDETGPFGNPAAGAMGEVYISKSGITLRGVNRNTVIVDGTKAGSQASSYDPAAQDYGRASHSRRGPSRVLRVACGQLTELHSGSEAELAVHVGEVRIWMANVQAVRGASWILMGWMRTGAVSGVFPKRSGRAVLSGQAGLSLSYGRVCSPAS